MVSQKIQPKIKKWSQQPTIERSRGTDLGNGKTTKEHDQPFSSFYMTIHLRQSYLL